MLNELFNDVFKDEIASRREESKKPRTSVYIVIGMLGLKQGERKILGVYPTSQQATKRAKECEYNHNTLFRKYVCAEVSVTADGTDCDLSF